MNRFKYHDGTLATNGDFVVWNNPSTVDFTAGRICNFQADGTADLVYPGFGMLATNIVRISDCNPARNAF